VTLAGGIIENTPDAVGFRFILKYVLSIA